MLPAWFHNIQERHESLREPPPSAACGTRGLRTVGGGARVLGAGVRWMCQPAGKILVPINQPFLAGFFFFGMQAACCALSTVWDEDIVRKNAGTP